jgi:DNA polymerase
VEAAILDLRMGHGADAHTLKALVRSMFLIHGTVVDYSSIEARVIAWLAGEEWALEAFRLGRDIYVETAARMSTPDNQLTRSQGKVAVLALGFQGSINSLRVMGGEGTDAELLMLVRQWREANPAIRRFWAQMESKFRTGGRAGRIRIEKDGDDRLVWLPSGRAIVYHNCRWREEEGPYGTRLRATFADPAHYGWRADTYGGRLAENVTQAVARDILAEALVRLEDAGLAVVGHVHDEVIVEAEKDVERVRRIMVDPPAWADGLPIDGAGFTCSRYRKD